MLNKYNWVSALIGGWGQRTNTYIYTTESKPLMKSTSSLNRFVF
jgi:hypothetical protein